jgi:hypothetical protein
VLEGFWHTAKICFSPFPGECGDESNNSWHDLSLFSKRLDLKKSKR